MILAAVDLTGVAAIIASLAVLVGAFTTAIVTLRAQGMASAERAEIGAKVEAVHKEVTTLNGSTLAMLADADESRRVGAIPVEERTDAEQAHVDLVPDLPAPNPPRTT